MQSKFEIKLNKRAYWLSFLIFLVPSFVFLLARFFMSDVDPYKLRLSIIETFFVSGIIFFLYNLLPSGKFKVLFYYLGYIAMSFSVFIQASYYFLYSNRISASTIFILIETNLAESLEFVEVYFNTFNFYLIILLIIPLFFVRRYIFQKGSGRRIRVIAFLSFILFLFVYHYKSLGNHNLYNTTWNSYQEYLEQIVLYDKHGLDEPLGKFQEVTIKEVDERRIFIMVVGESTTRHRMGLYNYPRPTNPRLEKIRDELILFSDVISPHTHTIPSLSKIMTLNNYEDEKQFEKGTIVQLMNQAGFETTWISNQRPVGIHENLVTRMANASSVLYFLNIKNYDTQSLFDEIILQPLNKVLQKDKDQFIVIHLLGTHTAYSNRYPESFDYFGVTPPLLIHPSGAEVVNEYDNAIRYNDYVISEIIESVKKQNAVSYVLYFSDHGEDVYQVLNGASHTETKGTYPMYDVPFILWQSVKFKENYNFNFVTERPYMLDDLIYSISDLSGIEFEGYQPERSLFNKFFNPRQRIIYDGKDYDSIFNK